MSNKTRDLEILDSRVSKLLIMLKRHIKITEEQLLSEETERKNADLELKALIDTKPSTSDLNNKVDKVAGKGFSSNDFTDEQKLKIQELEDRIQTLENVSQKRTHKVMCVLFYLYRVSRFKIFVFYITLFRYLIHYVNYHYIQ